MKSRGLICLAFGVFCLRSMAEVFTGSNGPGASTDFTIAIPSTATNVSLTVSGTATTWSSLIVKKGAAPADDSDYDYSSQLVGTNALYLESPDVSPGDFLVVRVETPTTSGTHSFTLTSEYNRNDLRTAAKPVTKPLPGLASALSRSGTNHYYRIELKTNSYLKASLSCTNGLAPDLYLGKDIAPTTASYYRKATGYSNNIVALSPTEATTGVYYIGAFGTGTTQTRYTLRVETFEVETLVWDPGLTHEGTAGINKTNAASQEYYFRIITGNPAVGAWRNALKMYQGNANLYLGRGFLPTPGNNSYSAQQNGSTGLMLALGTHFQPGEEWYLMVKADTAAQLRLVSGTPYVQNLGTLTADGSSGSGSVEIGPEGIRYFKTDVTSDVLAWRLWLNGGTNTILLRKGSVPLNVPGLNELSQNAQLLAVPPYLNASTFFIGVIGAPGQMISMDSRQQPISDLAHNSSVTTNLAGYGYSTYRVVVPANQIAWEIYLPARNGNPNVAVRRGSVPNETANDAYSELTTTNADNIVLVPPTLSDATFYITVYDTNKVELAGSPALEYTLQEGPPAITDIPYRGSITNDNPGKSGWKFYRTSNIEEQSSSLGWNLLVTNATTGTRIALRRANVPSAWSFRNPADTKVNNYDVMSTAEFLQRPEHEPDTWYVGIYNPTNVLGPYTLITGDLTPKPLTDNVALAQTNLMTGRWEFYNIELPTTNITGANAVLGWDLRVIGVSGGLPKIVVRKDKLPVGTTSSFPPTSSDSWPAGGQWAAGQDWTKRSFSVDGTTNEDGRILVAGLNHPLSPGSYYIGIYNAATNGAAKFSVLSRWVGAGRAIPITELSFNGGSITNTVNPREAAYYKVVVPQGSRSWRSRLEMLTGEGMLVVISNSIPSISSEKRMQKPGDEYYLRLPDSGLEQLPQMTNYLAVIGEGLLPTATRIGDGPSSFVMHSLGEMPEVNLGSLDQADILFTNQLAAGDCMAVHFQPVPGTLGFWSSLENATGTPWEVLLGSTGLPDPSLAPPGGTRDYYGTEGGWSSGVASGYRISCAGAAANETVLLKARVGGTASAPVWEDAQFTLRLKPVRAEVLGFDGGLGVITNGESGYGNFFVVDIPDYAEGWDLRLTNVTSGSPSIYISKDVVPLGSLTWTSDPMDATTWPSGFWLSPFVDWTDRYFSADGTFVAGQNVVLSKNRPLTLPGRYFVQIVNESTPDPVYCQVLSRGIGNSFQIPIQTLNFTNGVGAGVTLPPREAAYYRIDIPSNTPSWKVLLNNATGESLLGVSKDHVPNSGITYKKSARTDAGRQVQRNGDEIFTLLPGPGKDMLDVGSYYLVGVSEGMNPIDDLTTGTNTSSFHVTSVGSVPRQSLGIVGPGTGQVTVTNSLLPGEIAVYEFSIAAGTTVVEAKLGRNAGSPSMHARFGTRVPDPNVAVASYPAEYYGTEGGEIANCLASTNLLTWANPTEGTYTVVVKARMQTNAIYTLTLSSYSVPTTAMGFDVNSDVGTNALLVTQAPKSWAYFLVDVPTNAAGWDIRAVNVAAGNPKMVVRRGTMPTTVTTTPWSSPGTAANWPTNSQWAPGSDWTKRAQDANGVAEDGRILAMGMGRPLEPGLYYVGITNASTNVAVYTMLSRGIGQGFSIPIIDLPNQGSITNLALAPREAAYYRVIVPSGSPSWKLQVNILTNIGGECMLTGYRGYLPNFSTLSGTVLSAGKTMQKPGNEHFVLLPTATQTNLPSTTNYFAVVGEGKNPVGSTRIGTGDSGYVITSEPSLPVTDLGFVTSEDIVEPSGLQNGEVKGYRFTVLPGTYGVKVKLEDRAGNPVAVLLQGNRLPDPGATVTGAPAESYGNEGGLTPLDGSQTILTLANPTPGNYTVLVKARALSTTSFPDANYTLRVSEILSPEVNFSSVLNTNGLQNAASGTLENNERVFYRVEIPSSLNGEPIIGWRLGLSQSSGLATMRVSKDTLPQDGKTPQMNWASAYAIIAPPYLTNGVWFVEVRGSNSTAFTLTSEALKLERPAWVMPAPGQANPNPGVADPYFADTAVGTNGQPIDSTIFLEQGAMHYYAVQVPEGNIGLLRTELRASSGNPDVYLRAGNVPSLQHTAAGGSGTIYDRSMTAARDTEYANWVPLDGKTERQIKPGLWYIVVQAASNSNARYQLLLSAGNITELPLDSEGVTNQVALGGDWVYYRFQAPAALPGKIGIVFDRQYGDGILHVRDVVPPGNGPTSVTNDLRDWKTDAKNDGPYPAYGTQGSYVIEAPPMRPGDVIYLGLQAPSRSIFGLRVTNLVTDAQAPEELDFYGGSTSMTLAAGSNKVLLVRVPPEAVRWKHSSVHTTNVVVVIDQGTVPNMTNNAWKSSVANSSCNTALQVWSTTARDYVPAAWPWVPDQKYYVKLINNGTSDETVSITMDGRNRDTNDNDNNGLPDWWEMYYFGRTGQVATADPDGDGVVNTDEYIEGTNPNDGTSFNARIYIVTANGNVQLTPGLLSYPLGSTVVLQATPDSGYTFSQWGTDLSGSQNPLLLTVTKHMTITAIFRHAGDDFEAAQPLSGQNVVLTASNVGYTRQPGEPYHAGNYGGRSIWWRWTAPANGPVTITTAGSTFNTLLGVYLGTSVANLTTIASDNNSSGVTAQRSKVTFNAVGGTEYRIAVDGYNGASATIQLALTQSASGVRATLACSMAGGLATLSAIGNPGQTYTVESSTDMKSWSADGVLTVGQDGTGTFLDTRAAGPARFYRLRE